jgi:hypothetical protein
MTAIAADVLATTRRSLHGVAEAVVAGPQFRAAGTMRLRAREGGFGTVVRYGDVVEVAVEGTDLVVVRTAGGTVRLPLAGTFGELAEAAGLPFGGLEDAYRGGTRVRPDEPIVLDPTAAAALAAGWTVGDRALRAFAGPTAKAPVLWPEHFDIGVTVDEVDYGVSPGDETIAEPYAYVGPHRPRSGAFWNQPFGAARPLRDLPGERVAAFFAEGRRLSAQP